MLSVLKILSIQAIKYNFEQLNVVPVLFRNLVQYSSNRNNLKSSKNLSLPEYRDTPFGSQYSPLSQIDIADQKITEFFSKNHPKTFDDWHEAKGYFYTEIPLISDVNYSSVVMTTLLNKNEITLAQSFIKHLQESNLKPNILAYLQYLALCGKNVEHCGQDVIFETFKKIQTFIDNSPVLDLKRATYIILGLCGTDRWQSSFKYLKKIPRDPSMEIKNALASAAIRNGNETLAWEIITKWLKNTETINNQVVKEFLKYAQSLTLRDLKHANLFLMKFFAYIDQKSITICEEHTRLLEEFFERHSSKWTISHTQVSRTGECNNCQKVLKPVVISEKEFLYLKNSFLEKSVKKNDIFINTTEKEFHSFIAFIEKYKPFDIVVDGLNIAHTLNHNKSQKNLALNLLKVVENLCQKSRKILVMGRKHMAHWPHYVMRKISQRASIFLTNNISQDDPFTVYAALASGPHTLILTMDLMRDHMSRLDKPELINLFKKWQQSHQVLIDANENNLKILEPVRHSITVQGNMDTGWHIPFDDKIIRDPYEELNNWLCIRKKDT